MDTRYRTRYIGHEAAHMILNRAKLAEFADSTYAGELRRARSPLRFTPRLEEEYLGEHLRRVCPRVRIWTGVALLISIGFAAARWVESAGLSIPVLIEIGVILPLNIALMWLVWRPDGLRTYIKAAPVLAPLFGMAVAAAVAQQVAVGRAEDLATLTLLLIAAFFFMGLLFRASLVTGMAIITSYATTSALVGMPLPLQAKSTLFLALAAVIGIAICREVEHSYRRRFLEQSLISELVERDGLTGLKNRRALDEHLLRVWQQSLRGRNELAAFMIDIDCFKNYNDHYGHLAGDEALRKVADVIKHFARRPLDFAARYGGEEFIIVAFDMNADAVTDIAARLCLTVEALHIEHAHSECSEYVTVSVGVGVVRPKIGRTPEGLIQLADQALFQAKAAGSNGYVIHGQDMYECLVTGIYKGPDSAAK